MAQLNLNMTPALEEALAELMSVRKIKTKSETIRVAVHEALESSRRQQSVTDFVQWRGLACQAPANPHPRFSSDDDLWR